MTWKVDFSKEAFNFIKKQEITGKVIGEIKSFILKTKGEDINFQSFPRKSASIVLLFLSV